MNLNLKALTADLERGMRSMAIPTPAEQDHLEVRLLTLYITWSFINDLVGPITYVYGLAPSLLFKVAQLSHGTWLVGAMFIAALVLALPHAFALTFLPHTLATRWPRKAATWAACLVLVTWAYLAVLSLPLDEGPLFWLYLRQAFESAGLAFLYAISLNAQLLRAINKLLQP